MKAKIFVILCMFGLPLFAQTEAARLAPGAEGHFAALLNKPTMVKPVTAIPLGKNWFSVETDAHFFTDAVSYKQVAAALADFENQDKTFSGKRSKLSIISLISRGADEMVFDLQNITVAPLGLQIKTPYRASIKTIENTDISYASELRQLPDDSDSNKEMKNLLAIRFAQEVIMNGKTYTYIRIYSAYDVNASILPGAKSALENGAGPANEEALELIIAAAKTRPL